jgi:hypothetical protein
MTAGKHRSERHFFLAEGKELNIRQLRTNMAGFIADCGLRIPSIVRTWKSAIRIPQSEMGTKHI